MTLARLNPEQLRGAVTERVAQIDAAVATGEIRNSGIFTTYYDTFKWQGVSYRPEQMSIYECMGNHKGYLMIELPDLMVTLDILDSVGHQMVRDGSKLDFKWLIGKSIKDQTPSTGNYDRLAPTDPRIAIYDRSYWQIKNILTAVATDPRYLPLEENRIAAMGGTSKNAPRRPGTNSFELPEDHFFRSICYSMGARDSEKSAEDPVWRNYAAGEKTEEKINVEPQVKG